MQYLFLFLLLLVSCGKRPNEVSPQRTANVFTSKYEEIFFSEEGRPRAVILNALLENKLNGKKISAENFYRFNNDLREYEKQNIEMLNYKEEKLAKLYVSFEDKLAIYFMPEKVDLNILEKELNLPSIPGKVYSWAKREGDYTKSGDLLILANTNLDEVIQNDKKFYSEKIELTNQLIGVNVSNGMKIKIKIETDYLIQSLTAVRKTKVRRGHKGFARECSEMGTCQCAYTINQPSSIMAKYEINNANQIKFQVALGHQIVHSDSLPLSFTDKNKIETEFDLEENENDDISFQFKNLLSKVEESVRSYNAEDSECNNEEEVITRRINAIQRVVIEKWGRGERVLRRVKL